MFKRTTPFLSGLLTGLLAAGLLLLTVRPRPRHAIELLPAPTPAPLQVHVTGAVHKPGVITIAPDSIVQDAIVAAGGATQDADLSRLNLAEQLRDGQQIYVSAMVTATSSEQASQPDNEMKDRININTANEVQLQQLPGIGPSLAANIVEYREQHGWFQEVDELLQVSGIGPSKLDQIAERITLR